MGIPSFGKAAWGEWGSSQVDLHWSYLRGLEVLDAAHFGLLCADVVHSSKVWRNSLCFAMTQTIRPDDRLSGLPLGSFCTLSWLLAFPLHLFLIICRVSGLTHGKLASSWRLWEFPFQKDSSREYLGTGTFLSRSYLSLCFRGPCHSLWAAGHGATLSV